MKRSLILLLMFLILLLPLPAWGPTGHRVVAQIAMNHLNAKAKYEIEKLLGHTDLAMVANWADEIRGMDAYDYLDTWHFVTIDDGETYEASTKNPKGDVIQAILKCEAILADQSQPKDKRAEALKLLVHFMGDVHQPLHVGRSEDFGGNTIKVMFFKEQTNLHKVWDSGMIQIRELSFTEYARFLDHLTADQIAKLQQSNVMDWVNESMAVRAKIYTFDRHKEVDGKRLPYLHYDYRDLAIPIIEQRLAAGGIRLAGRLNAILGE